MKDPHSTSYLDLGVKVSNPFTSALQGENTKISVNQQ
jgi:hypothetical protein